MEARTLPTDSGVGEKRQSRGRKERSPRKREQQVLRLVSEQVAIRLDQLARFLRIDYDDAVRLIDAMSEPRWVRCKEMLKGEVPWVWLRQAGVCLAGTGYGYRKLELWELEHRYAVNEVRLSVMGETDGVWICERELWRRMIAEGLDIGRRLAEGDLGVHVPNAVVEVEGRSYAIAVELSCRGEEEWEEILAEHDAKHQATKYYCAPDVRPRLERVRDELNRDRKENGLDEVNVFVADGPSLDGVGIEASVSRRRGHVEDWEVPILAVLCEHGALRIDQLAHLIDRDQRETEQIVEGLGERGLAFVKVLVPEEPAWVWCSRRGARLSGTGLNSYTPVAGVLDRLRAINQVHVALKRSGVELRWFSSYVLTQRGYGKTGLPGAVAVIDGRLYAIEVVLKGSGTGAVERKLDALSRWCENVLCYTSGRSGARMRERIAVWGWSNVFWRELPSTEVTLA